MLTTDYERLRYVREKLRKSQKEFGQLIKIKQGSYSPYEKGKLKISDEFKKILKEKYSINIEWLETGKGEMLLTNINDKESKGEINFEKEINIEEETNQNNLINTFKTPDEMENHFEIYRKYIKNLEDKNEILKSENETLKSKLAKYENTEQKRDAS